MIKYYKNQKRIAGVWKFGGYFQCTIFYMRRSNIIITKTVFIEFFVICGDYYFLNNIIVGFYATIYCNLYLTLSVYMNEVQRILACVRCIHICIMLHIFSFFPLPYADNYQQQSPRHCNADMLRKYVYVDYCDFKSTIRNLRI